VQGMGSAKLQLGSPAVVAAFHSALREQGLLVVAAAAVALAGWRPVALALRRRSDGPYTDRSDTVPEPLARKVLRIGFGLLWVLDGILQTQKEMVLGMPSLVVGPAEAGAPRWVHELLAPAIGVWARHPVAAASSVVWIQLAVGALLLTAPRWWPSRAAGALSVSWALVVWIFGEALGGILTPGGSWLFGDPGGALFYLAAGVLIALPAGAWAGRRLARVTSGSLGAVLVAMALLQAWPGRGFWQGGPRGQIPSMLVSMARTPQPALLSGLLRHVGHFSATDAVELNVLVVAAIGAVGIGLVVGALADRDQWIIAATIGGIVAAIPTWIVFQDLGFLGGVGTDPNTAIPSALLLAGAALALRPAPAGAVATVSGSHCRNDTAWKRLAALPTASVAATFSALVMLGVGAVPAAAATLSPGASASVDVASNGPALPGDTSAAGFRLVDQHDRPVSLSSLRGKVVTLTFLDPVCTSDCPLIGQEMRIADEMVGDPARTAFVAVVANPIYRSVAAVDAFDREDSLGRLPNWYYLTGSLSELSRVWHAYGVNVQALDAGAMVLHSDAAFVIGPDGRLRWALSSNPPSVPESLAAEIAGRVRSVLR